MTDELDYTKYDGATPGPWQFDRAGEIGAVEGAVFKRLDINNPSDCQLVLDAPKLLARCKAQDARVKELEKQLAEATTWRSPETAPRDDYFLALMYGTQPCVIGRNKADTAYIAPYSAILFEDKDGPHFTGWLPLPQVKGDEP